MAYGIPQTVITEILEKSDIYEVISEYLTLKKSGKSYKANCPFHEEKTASFHVSSEKQIFHCFGCGAGGNVFNFLMKIENIEFPEAVYMMAKKTGVKINSSHFNPSSAGNKEKTEILEANKTALKFFIDNLSQNHGRNVVEYLETRGFPEKIYKRFSLGYAPYGNLFSGYLSKTNLPLEKFAAAGLVTKNSPEGNEEQKPVKYIDCFKNRLIIPIFDSKDNIVGFGGRSLEDNIQPKYLNTSENAVFKKGQILYGLNWAKENIKKEGFAIVVEGYFDLLKLHANDLTNVVAPLGTSLTDFHLKTLKRYTEKILLVFDSDQAGSSATLRSLESIIKNGFDVRIAPLPLGFDPDSFVDNYGIAAFKNFINSAKDFVEYKIALGSQSYDLKSVKGKSLLAAEILHLIRFVSEPIEQKTYIKKLSEVLGVEENILLEKIENIDKNDIIEEKIQTVTIKKSLYDTAEKMLIEVIIHHPDLYENIGHAKHVLSENVTIFLDSYVESKNTPADFSMFVSKFQEESMVNFLSQFAFNTTTIDKEKGEKILNDCIVVLSKTVNMQKIQELKKTIKQKEENNQPIEIELKEMQKLYYYLQKGRNADVKKENAEDTKTEKTAC